MVYSCTHLLFYTICPLTQYRIVKGIPQQSTQQYLKISKECNAFIHPNVFVNILSTNERAEKEKIVKDLLKTNVYLLKEAYELSFIDVKSYIANSTDKTNLSDTHFIILLIFLILLSS